MATCELCVCAQLELYLFVFVFIFISRKMQTCLASYSAYDSIITKITDLYFKKWIVSASGAREFQFKQHKTTTTLIFFSLLFLLICFFLFLFCFSRLFRCVKCKLSIITFCRINLLLLWVFGWRFFFPNISFLASRHRWH